VDGVNADADAARSAAAQAERGAMDVRGRELEFQTGRGLHSSTSQLDLSHF
jgi:hypothetical protein